MEKIEDRLVRREDINSIIDEINTVNQTKKDVQVLKDNVDSKIKDFNEKLEGFYGRIIEIIGIFIAIFSFIISGIQMSNNCAGSFLDRIQCSSATFLPLTLCIIVLIWFTKRSKK